jgi:hypothetical protein
MKRLAAAKSCGSTVSARSETARHRRPGPVAAKAAIRGGAEDAGTPRGDHKFVCEGRQYRFTGQGHELRQYRRHNSALLVKYF